MHVREKSLNKITDSDTVSTEEIIAFLEHLDQCDFCLDQMIEEEIPISRLRTIWQNRF